MLEITDLVTYYGSIRALDHVSLQVHRGEIVALIGANGAGKSTLLNTVSGLLKPRFGSVVLDGQEITSLPAESIVRKGMSLVPERRQIFGTLSVIDNLRLGAYHRVKTDGKTIEADIARMFNQFPILSQRRTQAGGTLSGGEQQMLAIARALMSKPRLLLLDEPSVGLAPLIVREILRIVSELRDQGTTILLIEQNANAALRIADRGYVMENGRISLAGKVSELRSNIDVQKAYLGRTAGATA